jgi:hypothetical protein
MSKYIKYILGFVAGIDNKNNLEAYDRKVPSGQEHCMLSYDVRAVLSRSLLLSTTPSCC